MAEEEIWKVIPNFSNYKVSNFGNVKNITTDKYLKQYDKDGYSLVGIRDDNKKCRQMLVHRLVGITFLPNPYNKPTINHIDHSRSNNNLINLEWATNLEQNIHKNLKVKDKHIYVKSAKSVSLIDNNTNDEKKFNSIILCLKYIYENNKHLFQKYKTFDEMRQTGASSRMGQKIKHNKLIYNRYFVKYAQIEILQNEIWKQIPTHLIDDSKSYYVSSMGRYKNYKGIIINGYISCGYIKIKILTKCLYIHKLIAQVFIPNIDNKSEVNHKDGNKQNNNINNLEWVSKSENCIHRSSLLSNKNVRRVIQYNKDMIKINEFTSIEETSRKLKISSSSIANCCHLRQVQTNGFIFRFVKNKDIIKITKNIIKTVIQYDLNMIKIQTFESVREASRQLNIPFEHIYSCCYMKQKQTGGFIFKFVENKINRMIYKSVIQYDLNMIKIQDFKSASEASQKLNISVNSIYLCCRGKQKHVNGFMFEYMETKTNIKPIIQYDLDMKKIDEFESIDEASIKLNIWTRHIENCCNKKQIKTNGFIFKYKEDNNEIKINKRVKPVTQYNLDMIIINNFRSILEASKQLNIGHNSITKCCQGKIKSMRGYIFKYQNSI